MEKRVNGNFGEHPRHPHGPRRPLEAVKAERAERYDKASVAEKLLINLRDADHVMRGFSERRGSQKRILVMLNETGTMTQRELTERLRIQPGSVSEILAKLEEAGYIKRTPSGKDRRTMEITLTENGKEEATAAAEHLAAVRDKLFTGLTEEEKINLLGLLEKLNADWEIRFREKKPCHGGGRRGPHHHAHQRRPDFMHRHE